MKDDELVKALQGDAKWVKRISWQNAPTGGSAEFLKVSVRIVEAATRIEQLARENNTLRNELCERCGRYKIAHTVECNFCRWRNKT